MSILNGVKTLALAAGIGLATTGMIACGGSNSSQESEKTKETFYDFAKAGLGKAQKEAQEAAKYYEAANAAYQTDSVELSKKENPSDFEVETLNALNKERHKAAANLGDAELELRKYEKVLDCIDEKIKSFNEVQDKFESDSLKYVETKSVGDSVKYNVSKNIRDEHKKAINAIYGQPKADENSVEVPDVLRSRAWDLKKYD